MSEYMTPQEKDEARYLRLARNWTYKEIGWKLGLKPDTISKYLKPIEQKWRKGNVGGY